MKKWKELATISLFEKNYISEEQFVQIKAYRGLNIFSLHNELRLLLYLSVTLFTSGIGILIYQNIDSIGHIAMLSVLFLIIIVSFYFCFKNASKFEKQETFFQNSLYDYLLLLANILTCTFVGYLQFQYQTFGTHYGLVLGKMSRSFILSSLTHKTAITSISPSVVQVFMRQKTAEIHGFRAILV